MATYLPTPQELLQQELRGKESAGSDAYPQWDSAPGVRNQSDTDRPTMSELTSQRGALNRRLKNYQAMQNQQHALKTGNPWMGVGDALSNIVGTLGERKVENQLSQQAVREAEARRAFAKNPDLMTGLLSTDPGFNRVGGALHQQHLAQQKIEEQRMAAALLNQQKIQAANLAEARRQAAATLSHQRGLETEAHMGAEGVQTGMNKFTKEMGEVQPVYDALRQFKSLTDPYHKDSGTNKAGRNIPGMGVGDNLQLTPMQVKVDAGGNILVTRGSVSATTEIPAGAAGDKLRQDQLEAQEVQSTLGNIVATYGRMISGLALTDGERANINRILSNTDWSNEAATLQAVNRMSETINGARERVFASTHPQVTQQVFRGYGRETDGSLQSWYGLAGEPLKNLDWRGHDADYLTPSPKLTEGVSQAMQELPSPGEAALAAGSAVGEVAGAIPFAGYEALKSSLKELVTSGRAQYSEHLDKRNEANVQYFIKNYNLTRPEIEWMTEQSTLAQKQADSEVTGWFKGDEREARYDELFLQRLRARPEVYKRLQGEIPPQASNDSDDIRNILEGLV